jgi:hypothetical protein
VVKKAFSGLKTVFEGFAGDEFYGLARGNADFVLIAGIDSGAGASLDGLECSEADELDDFFFPDARLDAFEHGFERAFCGGFAGLAAKGFLDGFDKVDAVEGHKRSL